MKTLRLLTLVLAVCLCQACTSKTESNDSQTTEQDSTNAPGVGAAPDNSREADVDSSRLPLDTAAAEKP